MSFSTTTKSVQYKDAVVHWFWKKRFLCSSSHNSEFLFFAVFWYPQDKLS